MKKIKQINGCEYFKNIIQADTFFKRLVGLMGKKKLLSGQAMLISPCADIHTCFMKFPIDAVFLDHNFIVVDIINNLYPWRFSGRVREAKQVLELPSGTVKKIGIVKGMQILFK